MKLLSRLRLQFSHLNVHKFRHDFNGTVNSLRPRGTEVETNEHFLLGYNCFSSQRSELFDNLYNINASFSKLNNKEKVSYLLYVSTSNPNTLNKILINLVIKFLRSTVRLDKSLIFDQRKVFFSFWFLFHSKAFFFFFCDRNYEFKYYYLYLASFYLSLS